MFCTPAQRAEASVTQPHNGYIALPANLAASSLKLNAFKFHHFYDFVRNLVDRNERIGGKIKKVDSLVCFLLDKQEGVDDVIHMEIGLALFPVPQNAKLAWIFP